MHPAALQDAVEVRVPIPHKKRQALRGHMTAGVPESIRHRWCLVTGDTPVTGPFLASNLVMCFQGARARFTSHTR
jgi:hypothetical protein